MSTPRYRVLEDAFIAPHHVKAGTVIETSMEPANFLQPMNAEAEAALQTWYHKEFDEKDDKGKLTGKTIKPYLMYAPAEIAAAEGEKPSFTLISEPPRVTAADIENSLGVAQLKPATAFSLPPPVLGPVSENLNVISVPEKKA